MKERKWKRDEIKEGSSVKRNENNDPKIKC